ncbi:MAG: LysR family transcriptional regulator [Pseudomonadota bacterium]
MKKNFNHWTEMKTAWLVAKLGTLSAAADALSVHRTTVLRHVDTLEQVVGTKLFQRHSKGYEPTEAGKMLMKVTSNLDAQINQWQGAIQRQHIEITGELIITGLEVMAPILSPVFKVFKEQHPKVIIRYLASTERFKLELGTAHIAFRAGEQPQEEDNITKLFCRLPIGLYAHKHYIAQYGIPHLIEHADNHMFVGPENTDSHIPFHQWLFANIPRERVTFRSNSQIVMAEAVNQGLGIGFLLRYTENPDLVEVHEPLKSWQIPIWMMTHIDLHHSAKVQAFIKCLKEQSSNNDIYHHIPASTL